MKDLISIGPPKLLQKTSHKGLGPGNLGVLIARAGLGKTACLIHLALDKILRKEKLVHLSLEEGPDKVSAYYRVICHDLVKALGLPDVSELQGLVDGNRIILAFLNRSFEIQRLAASLDNLAENMSFRPRAIFVDGLDFEKAEKELFRKLKKMAEEFELEMWFSALSHRHITEVNERGIPYPCDRVDDLFALIMQLWPDPSGLILKILKDRDQPIAPELSVRLDPTTFIALDTP